MFLALIENFSELLEVPKVYIFANFNVFFTSLSPRIKIASPIPSHNSDPIDIEARSNAISEDKGFSPKHKLSFKRIALHFRRLFKRAARSLNAVITGISSPSATVTSCLSQLISNSSRGSTSSKFRFSY